MSSETLLITARRIEAMASILRNEEPAAGDVRYVQAFQDMMRSAQFIRSLASDTPNTQTLRLIKVRAP